MSRKPDTKVTVHINGIRYRGAYIIQDGKMVVSAHGLRETTNDLSVLCGETGKAEMNLAKLVLVQMVKDTLDVHHLDPVLFVEGSTTQIFC